MLSELVLRAGRMYHLGLAPEELAPRLFLVGDPGRAEKVAHHFDTVDFDVRHREFVTLTGTRDGVSMTVIGTGIGADNVEIALVEAYALWEIDFATGARRQGREPMTVIRVGTSGGARDDLAPGTLGLSLYALGLDNTGRFYEAPIDDENIPKLERAAFHAMTEGTAATSPSRGKFHPYASKASPELAAELERRAREANADYVAGVTVTTPGFYGGSGRFIDGLDNTVPDIKTRLGEIEVAGLKVINFEMESSVLFRLAAVMGYRAATICPIISSPRRHGTVSDVSVQIEQSITIAMRAMLSIAQEGD